MRRFSARSYGWGAVAALLALGVVIVASAQAAPALKKNYEALVRVDDGSTPSVFHLILRNDPGSQQTLGSAQFTLPTGFTITANTTPASLTAGFNVTAVSSTIVQFSAQSSSTALVPGAKAEATVQVTQTAAACQAGGTGAAWSVAAKQSNDFSGTGNLFNLLQLSSDGTFASDTIPLRNFTIDRIATVTDALYPTVLTNQAFPFVTTAYDTCGAKKLNYSGASLTYSFLTNATFAVGTKALAPADYGTKAWSGGIANVSVTPVLTETPNTLTVTDPATHITTTSNSFDVVDLACTKNTPQCLWPSPDGKITALAPQPTTDGTSLGIGYNNLWSSTFTCGTSSLIGGAIFNINPHNYASDNTTFQVTLTYTKQAAGNGPASSFNVCLLKTMPTSATDWTGASAYNNGAPIGDCPTNPTSADAPCVVSKKRTSSGALQVILFLKQGDPWGGTGFG